MSISRAKGLNSATLKRTDALSLGPTLRMNAKSLPSTSHPPKKISFPAVCFKLTKPVSDHE